MKVLYSRTSSRAVSCLDGSSQEDIDSRLPEGQTNDRESAAGTIRVLTDSEREELKNSIMIGMCPTRERYRLRKNPSE